MISFDEDKALQDAIGQLVSAPREEGFCQAAVTFHKYKRYAKLKCLECDFRTEGTFEQASDAWNAHLQPKGM